MFTRTHRAWLVVAAAIPVIIAAGAVMPMAGLLVDPLHAEFSWSAGTIGVAVWINMTLNGLTAPFAAAMMDRFGLRKVAAGALATIAAGAALTTVMSAAWQFTLYWGLLIGVGTGSLAMAFAASVAGRWFVAKRGLVTGILSAASIAGQLLLQPLLASLTTEYQWRVATGTLAVAAVVVAPLAWLLLRDHPADLGLAPYGAREYVPRERAQPRTALRTLRVLLNAARSGRFWLLAGAFAICGATTNGVLWSVFVPAAGSHGMAATVAASLLAMVGICNVAGSLLSGWLTDRVDPRYLLAGIYLLRGLALASLPLALGRDLDAPLVLLMVLYGLMDMGTVPPTVALCQQIFGASGTVVFGWLLAAHQLGAGLMALFGGVARTAFGSYTAVWIVAGPLLAAAAAMALRAVALPPAAAPEDRTLCGHGQPG